MIPSALLIIGVLLLIVVFVEAMLLSNKLQVGVAFIPISFILAAAVAKYIGF